MKELSIIVPAYQAEAYIERCIRSILTNRIELEVLIVNDGSTDGTEGICRRMAEENPRVRVWTKENGGPGAAREYALAHAQGRYITFADADDYLEPYAYDKLAAYLSEMPDILEFGYRLVDTMGNALSEHPMLPEACFGEGCGAHYARQKNTTNYLWNKIFRRELFEKAVFLPLYAAEDAALMAQLFVFARIYRVIPEVLYNYVMTPDSLCRKPFTVRRMDALKAYAYVADFYDREVPTLGSYARQKLCSVAATLYCECARSADMEHRKLLTELAAVYRNVRRECGLLSLLRYGSVNRRMLLLLFTVSPRLCTVVYSWKRR